MDWTLEEEKKLYSAILKQGEAADWGLIASVFTNKTAESCQFKWQEMKQRGMIRGAWSSEEDEIILHSAREGIVKWGDVSLKLFGLRSGKQCRERWSNHLNPALKKLPWSDEEDDVIRNNQIILGNSWTKISKLLPGRSENEVKNRWYAVLSKRLPNTNNTPTSIVENEHSMNIGVKRKIEKAYDEMPHAEDSPKYNEEECENFIKEVHELILKLPHLQSYFEFEEILEKMGPTAHAFQEIGNHYLFSMFQNVHEGRQEDLNITTSTETSIPRTSSESESLNENHEAIQSLLRLHVSGNSTPASTCFGRMSQSTSPLWMEYGFNSAPASPKIPNA
eukprot:gene7670-8282_t